MSTKYEANEIRNMRWSDILQRMVEDDQNGTPMRWSQILQRWVEVPTTTTGATQ